MNKVASRRISSPFLVGLFSIIGVTLLVAVVLWLGANEFLKENLIYATYYETSVEGLEKGSPVKYQGVPVGTIQTIHVAQDGRMIEVIMQIDKAVKIDDSMRIKIEMSGLAGGKFLQLYYPTDPKIKLIYPTLSFEPKYTMIKSSPSGIEEFESAARDVMNNLLKLQVSEISQGTVDFLNSSTKFFDSESLYNIIYGIDSATCTLNNILKRADTVDIINNLSQTSKLLTQSAENLRQFSVNLNDKLSKIEIQGRIDHAISVFDSLMFNTQKVVDMLGYRTETALYGLNEAIEEVKSTNRQMKKSLRSLTDNPGQMLFSEPPKAEK